MKATDFRLLWNFAPQNDVLSYLNGIFFDSKNYAVATNGHVLATIGYPMLGSKSFLLAKTGDKIPVKAVEVCVERHQPDLAIIFCYDRNGDLLKKIATSYNEVKYPDWQAVMPGEDAEIAGGDIKISSHYLAQIWSALPKNRPGVFLKVTEGGKKTVVTLPDSEIKIVIMNMVED